jgi:hypothetical protein
MMLQVVLDQRLALWLPDLAVSYCSYPNMQEKFEPAAIWVWV